MPHFRQNSATVIQANSFMADGVDGKYHRPAIGSVSIILDEHPVDFQDYSHRQRSSDKAKGMTARAKNIQREAAQPSALSRCMKFHQPAQIGDSRCFVTRNRLHSVGPCAAPRLQHQTPERAFFANDRGRTDIDR